MSRTGLGLLVLFVEIRTESEGQLEAMLKLGFLYSRLSVE